MRQKQAAKTRCLAETCEGESHEACIALRERNTLTDLACDVSQSSGNHILLVGVWAKRIILVDPDGNTGQPDLPCVKTGEPQRADGAARNTPPQACCWSPSCGTREASSGMGRLMGSRGRANVPRKANDLRKWRKGHSSRRTGKPSTRWVRGVKEYSNGEGS